MDTAPVDGELDAHSRRWAWSRPRVHLAVQGETVNLSLQQGTDTKLGKVQYLGGQRLRQTLTFYPFGSFDHQREA